MPRDVAALSPDHHATFGLAGLFWTSEEFLTQILAHLGGERAVPGKNWRFFFFVRREKDTTIYTNIQIKRQQSTSPRATWH